MTCESIAGADNLGNHTATQDLDLSTFERVGNGGTEGVAVSNSGIPTIDALDCTRNSNGGGHHLGIDAFCVAIGAGTFPTDSERWRTFRPVFRFGMFQGGMALLGWLAGHTVEPIVADYDHWIAFVLLAYVGGRMILATWRCGAVDLRDDPSRGSMLV